MSGALSAAAGNDAGASHKPSQGSPVRVLCRACLTPASENTARGAQRAMAGIDRTSEHPPFRQIADELRARITRGQLSPGDKLPSARQLAASYQVTLSTAHRTLTELRAAGLVIAARGVGTIVRHRPPIHRLDRERRQPDANPAFPTAPPAAKPRSPSTSARARLPS